MPSGRSRFGSRELVWGDGRTTHREVIELADTREFGAQRFEWRAKASGLDVGPVAVWDVAGNGAFVNPFWRPEIQQYAAGMSDPRLASGRELLQLFPSC